MTVILTVMVMARRYVYIRKHLYDEIVKRGLKPVEFVNKLLEEALYGGRMKPTTTSPPDALSQKLESLEAEMGSIKEKLGEIEERLKRLEEATTVPASTSPLPTEKVHMSVQGGSPEPPPRPFRGERRGKLMTEKQHSYLRDLFERAVEEARRRGAEEPEEAAVDAAAAALLTEVRGVPRDEVDSEMLEEARDQVARALKGLAGRDEASEVIDALRGVLRRTGQAGRGRGRHSTRSQDLAKLLVERGYLRESDLREMGVGDVDAAMDALREEGAEILVGAERVAVDPDLYAELREKIEKVRTSVEEEVREILGDRLTELLDALSRAGLCYFDAVENRWRWL